MAEPLPIARNAATECRLLPQMANRHGLVTGATGTGKTVTLQALAEGLSKIGVPVFLSDVKTAPQQELGSNADPHALVLSRVAACFVAIFVAAGTGRHLGNAL
jgi:MoxR-like ATPase